MRERSREAISYHLLSLCTCTECKTQVVSIQNASCKSAVIADDTDTHTRTYKSAEDLYIYTPHAMNSMKWQDWAMLRAEEAMEWQR